MSDSKPKSLKVCPFCEGHLSVVKKRCDRCNMGFSGRFKGSHLSQMTQKEQRFIEQFVLNSGSLKEMAEIEGVSYPTIRNKLDEIIQKLSDLIEEREQRQEIIDQLEEEEISAEKAVQLLNNPTES